MKTECTDVDGEFHDLGRRKVVGEFDAGEISSDGGGLLLREIDLRIGLTDRLAACFTDYRNPDLIEHGVRELVAQRVLGLCLGYADLNDHDTLCRDSALSLIVGQNDIQGLRRRRKEDQGMPLASSSTLNRLELTDPQSTGSDRYKRIAADPDQLDRLFVDFFVEAYDEAPKRICLDVDATDDPIHGAQEGRFFHGYYRHYCYLPLYIFCGKHLLCARLRTSDQDGAAGTVEELERIIAQIREHWPDTEIVIRGDSGFCRDELMSWCEENNIRYLLGLARNQRLQRAIAGSMKAAQEKYEQTGEAARVFQELRYRTKDSWSQERRVVAKAEYLSKGENPRFIVTDLSMEFADAQTLYEQMYCARGEMENQIKMQQMGLFADRTSSSDFRANQLRLYFSSFAYVLIEALRRLGLKETYFERSQTDTLRTKLFKIGAQVVISVRRVKLSFSETWPYQRCFERILQNIRRYPYWHQTI